MDEQFRIPGTNFRFGLDPIINLIPVLGDISGFAVSATLVATMAKHGASGKILALMILNIVLDSTIGAIPLIGQIFDFTFKANTRNIKLLKAHYIEGKYKGSGKGLIATILIVLFFLILLLLFLLFKLTEWLFSYL
ncbi:MAG: DUF4112 domain-containing protein [Flavobacterium sp.]|nr:DUF4112 domain-containing protein [Pedobacter sp.]